MHQCMQLAGWPSSAAVSLLELYLVQAYWLTEGRSHILANECEHVTLVYIAV
jgi:hypothetical protein